ncbi:hypothetical protein E1091_00300 [Micromonospora fluostatini]|uniref:Uncharacterized protein n=1 Tax=Micromonospora fluostatini TaxID=1629071 RepID=A0ABY2DM89_9ACTN|nr:hypothetical protein E1091_00300 [Micromonospora fluostatini]
MSNEDPFRAYIDRFNGDAGQALLDFARRAGIAVAWVDRQVVERHFRELTDAEWELLLPKLDKYDEHVSNFDGVEDEFLDRILSDAGLS